MDVCCIDAVPHHTDPAFSRHHVEHRNHGLANVVEVLWLVYPFTSNIVTVPHRLDSIGHLLRDVVSLTVEELTLEEGNALDAKQHQDEKHDENQIQDVRHGVHERYDLDLETFVALEHSQGSQNTKQSEHFEEIQVYS